MLMKWLIVDSVQPCEAHTLGLAVHRLSRKLLLRVRGGRKKSQENNNNNDNNKHKKQTNNETIMHADLVPRR